MLGLYFVTIMVASGLLFESIYVLIYNKQRIPSGLYNVWSGVTLVLMLVHLYLLC